MDNSKSKLRGTPSKLRTHRRDFILVGIALLVLIVLVTLLIVRLLAGNSEIADDQPTYLSSTGVIFTLRDDAQVPEIDMTTATSDEARGYLITVLNSTTLDVYGATSIDLSGKTSADLIAKNIDQVVAANDIRDPAALLLFELEKARVYLNGGDTDAAWRILLPINENSLYESQKGVFYAVMAQYYNAIGDTATADHYYELYDALPWPDLGGE